MAVSSREEKVKVITLGITANVLMLMANHVKDNPNCKPGKKLCDQCEYLHCSICDCGAHCDHISLVGGCSHWETCGLNEAAIFLMECLGGMTPDQAFGLLSGKYQLRGESASTKSPDSELYLCEAPPPDFMEESIIRLNTWTEAVQKE